MLIQFLHATGEIMYGWGHAVLMKGSISCFLKLCGCTMHMHHRLYFDHCTTCAQIINYRENMLFRHKSTSLSYKHFRKNSIFKRKTKVAEPWHFGTDPDGSADPCLWLMNPDPVPAIFVIDLQDGNKKTIFFLRIRIPQLIFCGSMRTRLRHPGTKKSSTMHALWQLLYYSKIVWKPYTWV